jgi:membrane fusion protein, adhesin transport system
MLNLSPDNINYIKDKKIEVIEKLERKESTTRLLRFIYIIFFLFFIVLLLPWTQNIRSNGNVTTLRPEQRPQSINAIIDGRIEKWYVKDGDKVKKGDTILFLSEVKDGYFDPLLVDRTQQQLKSKELSVVSYSDKIQALDARVDALIENGRLKLQQAQIKLKQTQLKVVSDSIDNQAAQINYNIAKEQLERFEKLFKEGLKSQTELETRKLTYQRAQASLISSQQKLMQSRNDVIDAKVELNSIQAKFRDEIAKAESDKFTALSSMYEAEVDVTKLQNQVANYSIRNGMYYVLAPQDGIITKTISTGIGETIKQGDPIATIMPSVYDLAVEMYVQPMDLPLVQKGQKVRVMFDGWPAIVFSGWPNTSYGTYGGVVFAVDNFADETGKFRVLVSPDKTQDKWPDALRVGGGTNSMLLLNDVPIWYELWRVINGFPPDFYYKEPKEEKGKDKKK